MFWTKLDTLASLSSVVLFHTDNLNMHILLGCRDSPYNTQLLERLRKRKTFADHELLTTTILETSNATNSPYLNDTTTRSSFVMINNFYKDNNLNLMTNDPTSTRGISRIKTHETNVKPKLSFSIESLIGST